MTDPQQATPAGAPVATEVAPQPATAAMSGPDNMRLPPNPLAQQPGSGVDSEYKERFDGLNRRYRQDREQWEAERNQLTQQIQGLSQKMEAFEKQMQPKAPAPSPAPVSDGNRQQDDSAVYDRLAELEAERYRDSLLFAYMQPGQPGHNLPLAMFRDNIPVVAPDLNDDGTINDKGQRDAIERFIKGLQGIGAQSAQQTQQNMQAGWTPGASPGMQQTEPSQEDLLNEYYQVKEAYGNVGPNTPEEEVARLERRYYLLHEAVGKRQPGQSTPWMTGDEMMQRLNQLEGQLGRFQAMYQRGA